MNIKHAVTFVLSGLGVAVLAGCPIYADDHSQRVCVGGQCYSCGDSYYSSDCTGFTCETSTDCPSGYACDTSGQCSASTDASTGSCTKPADCAAGSTCGADDACHSGTCAASGCPTGYVCKLDTNSNGVPACAASGSVPGGGITSTCKSDTDCMADATAGSKCLTGSCVTPADQCADATQCGNGYQCVNGACTPACNASVTCPTGYACDTAKGVCTVNPTTCSSSSQCNGGTVCVDQHCVTACNADATCASGLVCVDGGCTPDERPIFTCATDGAQDACQAGSICLRHSCYIGCNADAGATACKAADNFNVCKTVTTSSGVHDVCGSATNLGTECDPTQAKNCASPLICIDGYCK